MSIESIFPSRSMYEILLNIPSNRCNMIFTMLIRHNSFVKCEVEIVIRVNIIQISLCSLHFSFRDTRLTFVFISRTSLGPCILLVASEVICSAREMMKCRTTNTTKVAYKMHYTTPRARRGLVNSSATKYVRE